MLHSILVSKRTKHHIFQIDEIIIKANEEDRLKNILPEEEYREVQIYPEHRTLHIIREIRTCRTEEY
jgi:hypothetical protein